MVIVLILRYFFGVYCLIEFEKMWILVRKIFSNLIVFFIM